MSLALFCVRLYLELFALASLNPIGARRENSIVLGGIEFLRDAYRSTGIPEHRAGLLAIREHLGELQPLAMLQKVRADQARLMAPRTPVTTLLVLFGFVVQLVAVVAGVLLVALLVLLLVVPGVLRRGH